MRRLLFLFSFVLCFCTINAEVTILSETIVPTENVRDIYKLPDGKLIMTFYQNRELTFASISKKEAERYWTCKKLGVKYTVVLQQLKTKRRIIIRC